MFSLAFDLKKGYVALTSVLVISAVILVLGVSVPLISINEIQTALSGAKNEEALDLLESCAEDALLYLNKNNNLPGSITLPNGSCSVTIDSEAGGVWTFTLEADLEDYPKKAQITASRTTTIQITSWKEL